MEVEDIEVQLFVEGMYHRYGYDFRDYSRAHIKRRVKNRLGLSGLNSISELTHLMLSDEEFFNRILPDFSINVTEMFRDPEFFAYFRKEVVPLLKTYPKLKIWHAGCSTGEEVYSMAILLKEEGLYERCQIFATDFNASVLKHAKEGIYPIDIVKDYTTNYITSGGQESFSDYYVAKYDSIILDQSLKKNVVFAEHNLVTDQVFNEMHLIICRNVLIYFNSELQNRVIKLFDDSLRPGGVLCLGTKESLKGDGSSYKFETVEASLKIYQKKTQR